MSGNIDLWNKYHLENTTFLFTSKIYESVKKLKIDSVLEIGCGVGDNLEKFKGKKVTGLDISDIVIQKAKKKFPKFKFHVGNILEIPLEEKFDLVITCGVVEHINPKLLDKAFDEMFRMSNKYILNIEASDETEHEVNWHRGKNEFWTVHMAKRWKKFPVKILQDINIDPEYRLTLISKNLK